MATLPAQEREALLEQVRALAHDFPPSFTMPYRTHVYWCQRV